VRLGTCVALELLIAVGAIGGVGLGVGAAARSLFSGGEAVAATTLPVAHVSEPIVALPAPEIPPAVPTAIGAHDRGPLATVFPADDAELLGPLGAPLTHVKVNHGGTSLSLRLDLASGGRAAFKPMQTHPQSDPRRELAAYRMDRLLGIGHVPPARAAVFTYDELVAAAPPELHDYVQQRLDDEAIAPGGIVRGVMSWWIPDIIDVKMEGKRLDDLDGMILWSNYLQVDSDVPPALRPMLAQISTCVVFDVVIDNADRWSGSNTKGSPDGKTLYFMDNTLAFSTFTLGHQTNLHPLRRVQVFSRALISRLRALTLDNVSATLTQGDDAGLAPLLKPEEIGAILARRDHVVRYVDDLIAEFGEDAVLAFP
jgi:hypothetical protein